MKTIYSKPIFQIFSKSGKEEIEKEKLKIIIDYREKNSLVASELLCLGFEIEFRELKVADYLVNNIAIERKTVSDFISSMINKRLTKQLEELQQYENKFLIIEGIDEQELYSDKKDSNSTHSELGRWKYEEPAGGSQGINPNAIRGFLLSIILKQKIPIIFSKNYEDTAKFINILARKKEKESSLNVTKKSLNKRERMQFILEGFPGIGPKTAKKLLSEFKTLKNIINASPEELGKVIGKKAEIFRLCEEEY